MSGREYSLEVEGDYLWPLLYGFRFKVGDSILAACSTLAGRGGECHVYTALVDGTTNTVTLARSWVPCEAPLLGVEERIGVAYSVLFGEGEPSYAAELAEALAREKTRGLALQALAEGQALARILEGVA